MKTESVFVGRDGFYYILAKDGADDKLISYLRNHLLGRSHVFGDFTITVRTTGQTDQIF